MIKKHFRPPKWEYVILSLIVLVLAVLGFAGAIVSKRAMEPVRLSEKFIHALSINDTDAAYELTAEPYRQTTSDEKFSTVVAQFSQQLKTDPKVNSHRIERSATGNLIATVEYRVIGTSERNIIVKLTQENNTWRVLNINNTL